MNTAEQADFDRLVAALDSALLGLGEPPVRDHPAFSTEPDWFPEMLCVTAESTGAADLRFMLDSWVRVDIAGFPECLALPLPGDPSRNARRQPPMVETLTRLLTSRATVTYRPKRTLLFLTDAAGQTWCRNEYWRAQMLPAGLTRDEPFEYSALCQTAP